jgi:flagellar FliJ protein
MARSFSLAGLLRLRQIQQDQAAGDLAAANARYRESSARQRQATIALGATETEVENVSVLYAVAAARAASRGMLAELEALRAERGEHLAEASAAYTAAKARSVGLEKLEARHDETVATGDLAAEQGVLDEISSASWHRDRNGQAV